MVLTNWMPLPLVRCSRWKRTLEPGLSYRVLAAEKNEEDMSNRQRVEAACGLVAALFGFLGLGYALFAPVYRFESSSGKSGTANMLQIRVFFWPQVCSCSERDSRSLLERVKMQRAGESYFFTSP